MAGFFCQCSSNDFFFLFPLASRCALHHRSLQFVKDNELEEWIQPQCQSACYSVVRTTTRPRTDRVEIYTGANKEGSTIGPSVEQLQVLV